ncbi:class I tRNA ligase family protein [bacterium]|nr:class I tRNA ligase family protein [bacterium]
MLIPLVNRKIPIIGDESVNTTKDNGIKRVTPCEDQESILLAQKYHLPLDHFVVDEKGNYTSYAGEFFEGKSREEFSKNIIQTLEDFRNRVPTQELPEVEVEVPYCRY